MPHFEGPQFHQYRGKSIRDEDGRAEGRNFALSEYFSEVDGVLALSAARAGLLYADFAVVEIDVGQSFVIGKHAMTAFVSDYAAGIYIQETADGTWIKVMTNGDHLRDEQAERILAGVKLFIDAELRQARKPFSQKVNLADSLQP